jgi:hypothetical protein
MDILQGDSVRELRATVLKIVYENHLQQRSRLRLVPLYGAVSRLFFDVSEDEMITVMQDLKERGYLSYQRDEALYRKKRKTVIGEIQILPAGRDLVEKTRVDPAVSFD